MKKVLQICAVLWISIGFLFLTNPVFGASNDSQTSLTQYLQKISEDKLNAEHKVLITGESLEYIKSNVILKGQALNEKDKILDVQLRRFKALNDYGQRYTSVKSTLTLNKSEASQQEIALYITDDIEYKFDPGKSLETVYPKESKQHLFRFQLIEGQWSLVSDEIINGLALALPASDSPKINENSTIKEIASNEKPERDHPRKGNNEQIDIIIKALGSFNPSSTVNYARQYWDNYNSAYRTYNDRGGDCTNFVSQALNWGGWQHKGGWYTNSNYWWYDPVFPWVVEWGNKGESRSWINVGNYFYWFARNSGRAFNARYWSDFRIGDTLQVDFNRDGYLDHNALVTRNDGGGNIYLTYHTNDTLDIPIRDFWARTSGSNYYGTLNYYNY